MKTHRLISTCLGVGRLPWCPGTWGSVFGLGVAIFLDSTTLSLLMIFLFFLGVWSSEKTAQEKLDKDPSEVVVDEFVGMGVSLLFLPKTLIVYIAAFILFRFFDITKPNPINKFEKLPGGWGIMMDDLVSGIASNIIIQLVLLILLLIGVAQ